MTAGAGHCPLPPFPDPGDLFDTDWPSETLSDSGGTFRRGGRTAGVLNDTRPDHGLFPQRKPFLCALESG